MNKKIAHVVTHTHWDREWYGTFQEFRIRLVDLMDHTMEIFDKDPEFKHFMLDGQTVVLDDYLEIKPKERERIKKLVQERKLFIGPWYVLVDEFLVSGEALIRNLLTGHRIARNFGEPMKVGYLSDQFGHISQIPQIIKGFDIDCAVTWRGFRGNPVRSEYNWEAPDGTSVLMYHLPECGYPMIINLPDNLDKTEEILRKLMTTLLDRSDSRHLLVHNGVDHLEPQPILTKLIRGLNKRFNDVEFIHSNLEDFFAELKKQNLKLPTARGELKLGYDHAFILVDILSSRMYLKQMNDQSQRGLEKYAEPLNALSVLLGGDDYSAVLHQGWKYVMQNHPHDTIGGCSIDNVHRDMIHRFRWADQISQDISNRALRVLAVSLPEDYKNNWESRLVLFNPTQYPFTGIVKKEIFFSNDKGFKNFAIIDYSGNESLAVIQDVMEGREIYPQFRNNPEAKDGKFFTLEMFVENLPPLGYRRYRVEETSLPIIETEEKTRNAKPVLENEHLKAKVNADGTLNVTLKSSGKTFRNLNYFESGGDAGDEYNFGKPIKDTVFTSLRKKARIIRKETTPFFEKLIVQYKMTIPTELEPDRKNRSKATTSLEVICEFKLPKNSKRIDVIALVHNHAKDHKFRVVFPSGKDVETYHADSKFDVIERPIKVLPKKQDYWETPTGIKPHDSFVDVSDDNDGLAIITRGTPEHEVVDAKGRPIAITLLRAIGWLSRGDGPYRRGNAGPPMPTPDAQMQGTFIYNYSIYPHDGTWEDAEVYREALQFNTPPTGIFIDKWSHGLFKEFPHKSSNLPNEMSFFTVEPDCFVVTATKQAEDNSGMILRICNLGTKEQTGAITFTKPPLKVWRTNLAEHELEELAVQPSTAVKNAMKTSLKLRAKEIGTIKVL